MSLVSVLAISSHHQDQLRFLAPLFPDCAILGQAERETCCDGKVKSDAGRETCYNQITHPEGTFDSC